MSGIPDDAHACPRCGTEAYVTLFRATDHLYGATRRRFNVIECRDCGLIRLHPTPSPEELKSYYPQRYWWQADSSAASRLAELYRQLALNDHVRFALRAAPQGGRALDVGCGGGSFLNALRRRGVAGVGADLSLEAGRVCWSRYGVPAVCGAPPALPFRPGSFGLVTLFHVLEHLSDPLEALESVWELLAPGGRLIVQTPNADCWQMLLLGERWSGLDVPRHLFDFRTEDLEDLLETSGFEIRRRKFFSLRDNPAGLATSLCPWLDPAARRVRGLKESPFVELLKNALYFGLVVAAVPFTLLEAAGAAGSTVMLEAARRGEA